MWQETKQVKQFLQIMGSLALNQNFPHAPSQRGFILRCWIAVLQRSAELFGVHASRNWKFGEDIVWLRNCMKCPSKMHEMCIYIDMFTMYACMSSRFCTFVCMYVCMSVCLYVCTYDIHACMRTYIHTYIHYDGFTANRTGNRNRAAEPNST